MKKAKDAQRFLAAMTAICTVFDRAPDKQTVDAYWVALEDLPIEQVEAACRHAMRSLRWFPKPAEMRPVAGGGAARIRAAEAWLGMIKISHSPAAGRRISINSHPTDKTANRALELLGPITTQAEMEGPWLRKQFCEMYADLEAEKQSAAMLTSGDLMLITDGSDA